MHGCVPSLAIDSMLALASKDSKPTNTIGSIAFGAARNSQGREPWTAAPKGRGGATDVTP